MQSPAVTCVVMGAAGEGVLVIASSGAALSTACSDRWSMRCPVHGSAGGVKLKRSASSCEAAGEDAAGGSSVWAEEVAGLVLNLGLLDAMNAARSGT